MNTYYRRTLAPMLLASLSFAALPGFADEPADTKAPIEVCAQTTKGMVPKERLVKALHKMIDMGETPKAATLTKEERRQRQFEVFWKEFTSDTGG